MKILIGVMFAAVVALGGYMLTRLSSDALGMAVGVVFGVLAGIPSALLVLASQRHHPRRPYDDDDDDTPAVNITYTVNNNTDNRQLTINTGAPSMPLLADREREVAAQRERRFVVVGEREEL